MKFLHREQAPIAPVEFAALSPSERGETPVEPISVEEFVLQQSEHLDASQKHWEAVPAYLGKFKTDKYLDALRIGVANNMRLDMGGNEPTVEDSQEVAKILLDNLATLWLFGARDKSSRKSDTIVEEAKMGVYTTQLMPDPQVMHAVTRVNGLQKAAINSTYVQLTNEMRSADAKADLVINKLAQTFLQSSERAQELRDVLFDPVARQDRHLAELKKMIDVDWFRPNPADSVLKSHMTALNADPTIHLDSFAAKVATSEQTTFPRLRLIRDMAQFALACADKEVTPGVIERIVRDNYDKWANIGSMEQSFTDFANSETAQIKHAIEVVAGKPDPHSLRTHRDPQVYEKMRAGLTMERPMTRREKRSQTRNGTARQAQKELQAVKGAISATTIEAEKQPRTRDLFVFKAGRLEPFATTDELVEHLTDTITVPNNAFSGDVRTMINHLRSTELLLGGLVKLRNGKSIKTAGKEYHLWAFAPNKVTGLRVSGDNRYYRLTCAFDGGRLIVDRIMSHSDYDSYQ